MPGERKDERQVIQAEQDTRNEIAEQIDSNILAPFALLAGLLSSTKGNDAESLHAVGNLIGLMVHGSRKELDIQRLGGYGAYALQQMLDDAQPKSASH